MIDMRLPGAKVKRSNASLTDNEKKSVHEFQKHSPLKICRYFEWFYSHKEISFIILKFKHFSCSTQKIKEIG